MKQLINNINNIIKDYKNVCSNFFVFRKLKPKRLPKQYKTIYKLLNKHFKKCNNILDKYIKQTSLIEKILYEIISYHENIIKYRDVIYILNKTNLNNININNLYEQYSYICLNYMVINHKYENITYLLQNIVILKKYKYIKKLLLTNNNEGLNVLTNGYLSCVTCNNGYCDISYCGKHFTKNINNIFNNKLFDIYLNNENILTDAKYYNYYNCTKFVSQDISMSIIVSQINYLEIDFKINNCKDMSFTFLLNLQNLAVNKLSKKYKIIINNTSAKLYIKNISEVNLYSKDGCVGFKKNSMKKYENFKIVFEVQENILPIKFTTKQRYNLLSDVKKSFGCVCDKNINIKELTNFNLLNPIVSSKNLPFLSLCGIDVNFIDMHCLDFNQKKEIDYINFKSNFLITKNDYFVGEKIDAKSYKCIYNIFDYKKLFIASGLKKISVQLYSKYFAIENHSNCCVITDFVLNEKIYINSSCNILNVKNFNNQVQITFLRSNRNEVVLFSRLNEKLSSVVPICYYRNFNEVCYKKYWHINDKINYKLIMNLASHVAYFSLTSKIIFNIENNNFNFLLSTKTYTDEYLFLVVLTLANSNNFSKLIIDDNIANFVIEYIYSCQQNKFGSSILCLFIIEKLLACVVDIDYRMQLINLKQKIANINTIFDVNLKNFSFVDLNSEESILLYILYKNFVLGVNVNDNFLYIQNQNCIDNPYIKFIWNNKIINLSKIYDKEDELLSINGRKFFNIKKVDLRLIN